MKNIAGLMKQAAQMQQKMEELRTKLSEMTIEGAAGAGMVTVTMNGKGEMKAVRVDPKLLDPNDVEMLQDLVMAAHADAKRKIEAMAAEEMQKLTGGLNLPPGMKLPF
jgi:nucleoid-associated protein EbfC